jgi:hypothetical protein
LYLFSKKLYELAVMRTNLFLVAFVLIATTVVAAWAKDDAEERSAEKESLAKLQTYVGQWKGVGQVRRGSVRGSWWSVTSEWAWRFDDDTTSLSFVSDKAKFIREGELQSTGNSGDYELVAKFADERTSVRYTGKLDETGKLVFVAEKPVSDLPARVSIWFVAKGDRMLILYEQKSATSDRYLRMAEVGFTRKGSNFGKGATYVECVVTGGKGTIPVTHKGKAYYVCCGGCRDYFNEDPERALAEYRERKEAEKRKKSS